MQLTGKQKRQRVWFEFKDFCAGAAFPLMLQLILSASIILFADYTEEIVLSVLALLMGEAVLIGAYLLFGRQNGITAYRRTIQGEKKREANSTEAAALYKTGEYALWKGVVIGFLSVVPFIIFEFIQCVAPNIVTEFLLKYAFGWAVYPFIVIGQATGKLPEALNFIWIVVPICLHAGAYFWGASLEIKRQIKVAEAQQLKEKRRK